MRAALIGPPQSGKTSLFAAVTGRQADPAHVGQEQVGTVKLRDRRLEHLRRIYKPAKYTPATMEFVDFPGFSTQTAQHREDLTRHLPALRVCDVLAVVVRGFESEAAPPYRGRIDPRADLEEIRSELLFCDLEQVSRRIEKLEVAVKKPTRTQAADKHELDLMNRVRQALESEQPVSSVVHGPDDERATRSFGFLTEKPLVVVVNVNESQVSQEPPQIDNVAAVLLASAQIEAEMIQLDEDERGAFMADLGLSESAADRLARACFRGGGLITFFTTGSDELRAWPIREGDDAVTAAAKVHTDIARGFIRAETVAYDDFAQAGDFKAAKAAGKVRLEGKSYHVRDGDIINFRFNI